jgi:hypothetical protein
MHAVLIVLHRQPLSLSRISPNRAFSGTNGLSVTFAPNGMLIAPTPVVTEGFWGIPRLLTKEKNYVVDDSCDFARAVVTRIHWWYRRWTDSSAARHRADCVHHQPCIEPPNCIASRSLLNEVD